MGGQDSDVLIWATVVRSRAGPGLLAGVPRIAIPPLLRAVCTAADGWWVEWEARGEN